MQYLLHPSGIPRDLSHTGICTGPGARCMPREVVKEALAKELQEAVKGLSMKMIS